SRGRFVAQLSLRACEGRESAGGPRVDGAHGEGAALARPLRFAQAGAAARVSRSFGRGRQIVTMQPRKTAR
ncbi:hypothetical protein M3570_21345, partial [Bacillus subtilis]|nr:hypothetical protein [Bacillus subtilis]